MNIPGLPDSMLTQQTWSNAQVEQLSLIMAAAASQMSGTALPLNMPGSSVQSDIVTRHIPDGKSAIRYPEPDVKSLVYDPVLGYRFDSATGLHYDANSGLFINKKLDILLRYDNVANIYERAGSTADITAPVLVKEFAELMGYDTEQTPANLANHPPASFPDTIQTPAPLANHPPASFPDTARTPVTLANHPPASFPDTIQTPAPLANHPPASFPDTPQTPAAVAIEAPPPTENTQIPFPSVFPPSPPSPSFHDPFAGVKSGEKRRSPSYDEMSLSPKSPGPRDATGKYSPQRWSKSPKRGRLSPGRDRSSSPRPRRDRRRSSSDDRSKRGRGRSRSRSRRSRSRSRSRSESSTSPPRKSRGRRSRSKDQKYIDGGDTFEDNLKAIARLHARNLRDPDNVFGRFLPRKFTFTEESQLQFILVTPLPPKGDREWTDLEILFKGILSANNVPYETVSVIPQGGNAPCDHSIIRFKKPQDAMRWYLLHQGALDLANPDGSKRTSYLYFSNLPWKCGFCKELNFPLRFFCYGCFKPQKIQKQMGTRAPLIVTKMEGCKVVGIKNLDYRITTTQEVLELFPPLDAFDIKSCEYVTEENGLPLGLCIFELADKQSAKEFHKFLLKLKFNPVFLLISSRVGLSDNPHPFKKSASKKTSRWVSTSEIGTQTSLTRVNLGDYVLSKWPVNTEKPNEKGTQTVLAYKHL